MTKPHSVYLPKYSSKHQSAALPFPVRIEELPREVRKFRVAPPFPAESDVVLSQLAHACMGREGRGSLPTAISRNAESAS